MMLFQELFIEKVMTQLFYNSLWYFYMMIFQDNCSLKKYRTFLLQYDIALWLIIIAYWYYLFVFHIIFCNIFYLHCFILLELDTLSW